VAYAIAVRVSMPVQRRAIQELPASRAARPHLAREARACTSRGGSRAPHLANEVSVAPRT